MDEVVLPDIKNEFPILETKHLRLEKIDSSFVKDIYEYASDPEVTRFVIWPRHKTLQDTSSFLYGWLEDVYQRNVPNWAMIHKKDNRMMGTAGYSMVDLDNYFGEIGVVVHRNYWGQHLGGEAAKKIISYGFETMHLHRIQARTFADNISSRKSLEEVGFHLEGIRKHAHFRENRFLDEAIYAVLAEEWDFGKTI